MYKAILICFLIMAATSVLEGASEQSAGAGNKPRNPGKDTGKTTPESQPGDHRDSRTFDLLGLLMQGIFGGAGRPSRPSLKPGQCPPVRPQCPVRQFVPPQPCVSDGYCPGSDKCCFDRCLEQRVCKPVSVFG
ncbi:uncharacterized protein [Macrobrachium rosenbergii]|uniref:uncharacterized protein n=1 Tax=Macrobrachium rosenbergii TaxID=79674 RepID=UPI0034D5B973